MWTIAPIFLFLTAVGTVIYGSFRWKAETQAMRAKLRALYSPAKQPAQDLENLPEPVQRFFRAALPPSPVSIGAARFTHVGTFNMSETEQKWVPFRSDQLVITNRPGFDWNAKIAIAPGLQAFAHDAYVNGTGILHVEALGVIPLVDMAGTPEIAQGELQRFLAEAAWYPTLLLPRPGLQWEPVDAESARATLCDGPNTASLTFHFNPYGLIDTVHADARFRAANGAITAAPWECRLWDYETHDGMQIPTEGEVSWILPSGKLPYWRGQLTSVNYEFERAAA